MTTCCLANTARDLPAPALPALDTFPVRLVCPRCGAGLENGATCSCPAQTPLDVWKDIPRTFPGRADANPETGPIQRQLLSRLGHLHWTEALRQTPGGEPLLEALTSNPGPDFLYGISWDEIDTVLDIGSGLGFLAAPLAQKARHVVAVDMVPEHALFLATRARQDGLDNLHCLVADFFALPFEPGSFDLITMNGLLETIGLWGQGNPGRLQRDLLARANTLLRPGGCIYIALHTRFGLKWWLGRRDQSGLRFAGLLPRPIANFYCRLRGTAGQGASAAAGYRTYRHTPRQYQQMLAEAGFETSEVFGCVPGYGRQLGLYPLADYEARREMRNILGGPTSWLGAWWRKLSNSRWLYDQLEEAIVLFGKKRGGAEPLVWVSGKESTGTVTQLNTAGKICLLAFDNGQPRTIAKTAKFPPAGERLHQEFRFLSEAQARLAAAALPLRWPRPIGQPSFSYRRFYQYEYVKGDLLSTLLQRRRGPSSFPRLFADLCRRYVVLCSQLTTALEPVRESLSRPGALADLLSEAPLEDRTIREKVKAGCRQLRAGKWPLACIHGDLALMNVIVLSPCQMVLIDWENASSFGLVAIDLMRLLYDTWRDAKGLSPRRRETLMSGARSILRDWLARLGVGTEETPLIEALYVAEQLQCLQSHPHGMAALLEDYHGRPLGGQ